MGYTHCKLIALGLAKFSEKTLELLWISHYRLNMLMHYINMEKFLYNPGRDLEILLIKKKRLYCFSRKRIATTQTQNKTRQINIVQYQNIKVP